MFDLIRATAAPTLIEWKPGRHLWVSPPSLRSKATILQYLAHHPLSIARYRDENENKYPGWEWIPRISSHLSISILMNDGFPVMLHAVTRRDHPRLSYDKIVKIAEFITTNENAFSTVALLAFTGHPKNKTNRDPKDIQTSPEGIKGIESTDMGEIFAQVFKDFPPSVVARMTEDQMNNVFLGGKPEPSNRFGVPQSYTPAGTPMTPQQAVDYANACREAAAQGREIPPCPS